MALHFEWHYTKSQMLAMVCFATIFLILGYAVNDCRNGEGFRTPTQITASIAQYHLGEVILFYFMYYCGV